MRRRVDTVIRACGRATLGEDVDNSDVEEALLNLPPSASDDDDDDEAYIPDTTEPLLDLITAQKFIGFVGPILELVKLKAGTTCTKAKCDASPGIYQQDVWDCSPCEMGVYCWTFLWFLRFAAESEDDVFRKSSTNHQHPLQWECLQEDISSFQVPQHEVQRLYAAPAVDTYWTMMQTHLLTEKLRQRQVVRVSGDGRNDSPGHSAQFCTYSFAGLDTDAILHIEVVDVRQATSSVAMEKIGFQQGLDFLLSKVDVREVVTDQSPSI